MFPRDEAEVCIYLGRIIFCTRNHQDISTLEPYIEPCFDNRIFPGTGCGEG